MPTKTSKKCFPCGIETNELIPIQGTLVCLKCMNLISDIGMFRGNLYVSKNKLKLRPQINSYFALFCIYDENNEN